MSETNKTDLDRSWKENNRTQFFQRRMIEKIQRTGRAVGLPKITCASCEKPMPILSSTSESFFAKCQVCSNQIIIEIG